MGFFSTIFGTTKSIETAVNVGAKVAEGVVNGLDKIWYTEEEKAEARQKAMETVLQYWEVIAKENTEQSRARRILAKMTFQVFFFFLIAGFGLYRIDPNWSAFGFKCAQSISFLISAIAVIYFGPHQLSKVWKKDNK